MKINHPSRLCENKPNLTQFSVGVGFGALGLVLGICLVFWIWCLGFYYLVTATNESRATSHGPALRSPKGEGGSRATIMQNKPNLQKCETNRILCPERTYETTTARNSRKNKANLQKCENEPNFLFGNDLRK